MSVRNLSKRERRVLGVTDEEWRYELIAEALDAQPGVFQLSVFRDWRVDLRRIIQVVDDFVAAGFLRELDMRDGLRYVRTDVACAMREPVMHLYRCYDADGVLLYVGVTLRTVEARIGDHSTSKAWWQEVARIDREQVVGFRRGLQAERTAIATERPRHNKANNPARRKPVSA